MTVIIDAVLLLIVVLVFMRLMWCSYHHFHPHQKKHRGPNHHKWAA